MNLIVSVLGVVLPVTLAIIPYGEVATDVRHFPRVFGFLRQLINPFSFLLVREPSQPNIPEDTCSGTGGKFFGSECLQFLPITKNFFDARAFCRNRGGDLWVPTKDDLRNPFFFQKLLAGFPELFKATDSEVLLGISKGTTTGYMGVDGTDLSSSPFLRTNDDTDNLCGSFSYDLGHLDFVPRNCMDDMGVTFVCEYPIRSETQETTTERPTFLRRFYERI